MELLKARHIGGEEAYRCAVDNKAFEPFLPGQQRRPPGS